MTTLLFDTLKLSKTLQENGRFTLEQANALAEGISGAAIDSFAASSDVKILATQITFLATKEDLQAVENRLLRWIVGAGAFQVISIIVALYLHK
jgi:hypothetical protein